MVLAQEIAEKDFSLKNKEMKDGLWLLSPPKHHLCLLSPEKNEKIYAHWI